jgi:CSLREA domain-containing protein
MPKSVKILSGLLYLFFMVQAVGAAVYTVTKTADTNDGVCDADCSLREAIAAANANVDNDVIEFSALFNSPQTITLAGTELVVGANGSLTINGPGANLLTISGNNASRILSSSANAVVNINNLRFTAGNGVGAANSGRGGAIYNVGGTMVISNSIITGNTANNGGGLNNAASTSPSVNANLTLNNCIVSNNTSTSSGGGMQNFSTSTVTINNSLFVGNTSGGSTGGGGAQFNGGIRITNSTFANNNAPGGTGGGFHSNGTLGAVLTNVTIVGNTSTSGGGGINRATTNANFFIRNSIVAGNNGVGTSPDITNSTGGIDSEGNNIIGNVGTSTGWEASDLLNTNPMLNPLGNNGGFSDTFLPMPGSPAINGGQNCVVNLSCAANNPPIAVNTDQRGVSRPQGGTVDIGAVEVAPTAPVSVSGKVVSASGNPIGNAIVMIFESPFTGVMIQTTTTNNFGNFRFTNIPAGQTYTIDVRAKQYTFSPTSLPVNSDVFGLTITANNNSLQEGKE